MPSACTKPENKASNEAADPIKQVLNVVDKKVRNLEKRKGKLDGYRENFQQGKELNEDQREAVGRYDVVLQNLEFARELQKQFLSIQVEVEKLLKKQLKRETHERQQQEIRRIKELLAVQNLLDSMGSDEVRSDFVEGKQGAVQLSEENLNQLDELYKLISPQRDGDVNYEEQMTAAADHIVNFLDAKEKEVAGTTYKDLKTLVEKISECGYFEKKDVEEEVQEEAQSVEVASAEDSSALAPQEAAQPALAPTQEEEQIDFTVAAPVEIQASPQSLEAPVEMNQPLLEQPPITSLDFGLGSDPQMLASQPQPTYQDQTGVGMTAEEETFFSTSNFNRPRPFNEIVSSVQGSFNFLQDSEIEQQNAAKAQAAAAQQMDPAVVAAQMVAAPSQQNPDSGLNFLDNDPAATAQYTAQPVTQSTQETSEALSQSAAGSTQFAVADIEASSHQSIPDTQQYSDQTVYAQSLMTQSLQNTAQQYEASQQSYAASEQPNYAQMGSGAAGSTDMADSSGPQPIPMPGQYDASSQDSKNKKQFSMNPDADIFQSMYTQAGSGANESSYQQTTAPSDKGYGGDHNAWSSQTAGYDNGSQGYNNQYGGNRRGNSQNYRGNRGMSNGYRGNGGRGGSNPRGRGGQYNGRGGGMQGSRGNRGSRGSGNRGNRNSNYDRSQRMGSQ